MLQMPYRCQIIQEMLWRHSITTAITSVQLNRLLGLGFHGEDFTAGLIHDFGRMLLAASDPEWFEEFDDMDFDETGDVTFSEREALGTDHCEVGAWYAEVNRLPLELKEVMLTHHGDRPTIINPRLTALTRASDHIANYIHQLSSAADYPYRENPGLLQLEELGSHGAVECVGVLRESLLSDVIYKSLEMSKPLRLGKSTCGADN